MVLLDVINLKTHFPTQDGIVKAVDTVNLRISEGERLGLIGETGCGKTILGMSIVRLLRSSTTIEGQILYNGKDLLLLKDEEMRRLRGKEIAMILQNPNTSLNPVIKVGDQIAEAIQIHKDISKREAKGQAIKMITAVKIPDAPRRANMYPHEFSGGMNERLMIAMGLASEPHFIIADEPTKNLDNKTKAEIVKLIIDMTTDRSMLIITHDLGVAGDMCDRIAVMYAGEILEESSSETILSNPMHPYTQGFIDSIPSRGLHPIRGSSPSLIDPPNGCRFHPRCPYVMNICKNEHPEMKILEKGHLSRCFLWN